MNKNIKGKRNQSKFIHAGMKVLGCLWLPFLFAVPLFGQSQLERISIAERGDGLGLVMRYHLTEMADSFRVSQPAVNLVQVRLFAPGLEVQDSQYISPRRDIRRIQLYPFSDGVGVDIHLVEGNYFRATIYPDQNQRHVLLSLAYSDRITVDGIAAGSVRLFGDEGPAAVIDEAEPDVQIAEAVEEDVQLEIRDETPTVNVLAQFLATAPENRNVSAFQRITPGDPLELYMRFITTEHAEGGSSQNIRPVHTHAGLGEAIPTSHPWMNHPYFKEPDLLDGINGVALFAPKLFTSHNTYLPRGHNDGALWQGVGLNHKFTTGVGISYGAFTAVLRPVYAFSENGEFPLSIIPVKPGLSPYAMPLSNIDMPLRFGENSIRTFNLGDSFIQAEHAGFAAGISNERIWTGPALYNPLIFSNNAPGFVHGFVGTAKPYETPIGHVEARWIWGGLKESEFFDEVETNNLRYVTAFTLNYSPAFVPGLHVGFTRAGYSYYPEGGLGLGDVFGVLRSSQPKPDPETAEESDVFFSMMTFFGRYHLPAEGFEVYYEWGLNNDRRSFRDLISEPEMNRGYVLGFIKRFTISPRRMVLFNSEITNLENTSIGPNLRDFNIWYTHDVIRQGFTNRGQVLGASIGPGSATQMAQLSYYDSWGMVGASIARVAHFNDRHFRHQDFFLSRQYVGFEGALLTSRHEIEFRYGLTGMLILPYNFELQASYTTGKVENRYNRRLNDVTNHHVAFTLRYNLPGFLR